MNSEDVDINELEEAAQREQKRRLSDPPYVQNLMGNVIIEMNLCVVCGEGECGHLGLTESAKEHMRKHMKRVAMEEIAMDRIIPRRTVYPEPFLITPQVHFHDPGPYLPVNIGDMRTFTPNRNGRTYEIPITRVAQGNINFSSVDMSGIHRLLEELREDRDSKNELGFRKVTRQKKLRRTSF